MVYVHTQPEITRHHVKPPRIFPYTQLYHAPVGPRSACSATRQKARRASPRQVSTARPLHRIDDRGRTQGRDDVREVLDVGDLDIDQHLEKIGGARSEEHTSELQSLMRISYAVFCLKK